MRRFIAAILTIAAVVSCTKESELADNTTQSAVTFSTESVASRVVSTTSTSTWKDEDLVGISCSDGTQNVEYITSINGTNVTFTHSDDDKDQHLLPRTGTATYSAYYPYQRGSTYISDVTDQTDLGAIDMLVSDSVEASEAASQSVLFSFTHALAMLSFSISANDTVSSDDLESLSMTLSNVTTIAEYDYSGTAVAGTTPTTGIISLNVSTDGTSAVAIINPYDISGGTLTFTLGGSKIHGVPFSLSNIATNTVYSYDVILGYDKLTISDTPAITNWVSGSTLSADMDEADIVYDDGVYLIRTALGLQAFANLVNGTESNGGAITYNFPEGVTFSTTPLPHINGKLTQNVDLSNLSGSWSRIGNINDCSYSGTFDGDGHEVQNLYISATSKQGLFGYTASDGVICNLGVTGSVTSSSGGEASEAAGIVSWNLGLVINCYNEATIIGDKNVGGIAGYNAGDIVNCYNLGDVTANGSSTNVGGIAAINTGKMYNGYNAGTVMAMGSSVNTGGVVGNNNFDGKTGTISNYYTLDSNTYSVGNTGNTENCETETVLKSSAFVSTLNDNTAITAYQNLEIYTDVELCKWNDVADRYPTLNFDVLFE